jgi:hypothetical protein
MGARVDLMVATPDRLWTKWVGAGSGSATIYDLAPRAGGYVIELGPPAEGLVPYVLTATRAPPDVAKDAEPNDVPALALPIDADAPTTIGRLATSDDRDLYRLDVPDDAELRLRTLRLVTLDGSERRLCLYGSDGSTALQCRSDARNVALRDLLLAPGAYYVEVGGPASLESPYRLRLDEPSPTTRRRRLTHSTPTSASAGASWTERWTSTG